LAKVALHLSDGLLEHKSFPKPLDHSKLQDYVHDITDLVDFVFGYLNDDLECIQSSVEKYFYSRQWMAGLDLNLSQVSWTHKTSETQNQMACRVASGDKVDCFYVKTYPCVPDVRELFVYKLLEHIGIGPQVHYIFPALSSTRAFYVATRECPFSPLSTLTLESSSLRSLVQLDLIWRVLCLRDCTTNSSSCGLADGRPVIVDFRITTENEIYSEPDIVDSFFAGNGEYNYAGLMKAAMAIPNDQKKTIMHQSLHEWNLVANMDKTALELDEIHRKIDFNNGFHDDLDVYIGSLKRTIQTLCAL